ncbi:unnamed protein product [Meloidogyne enterolobii]|uniref:Uncharacterized protein n=1 Tax=Meloidogyne enterolobii TaxID=390850 RepID=A0ACB1AF55_MELEN
MKFRVLVLILVRASKQKTQKAFVSFLDKILIFLHLCFQKHTLVQPRDNILKKNFFYFYFLYFLKLATSKGKPKVKLEAVSALGCLLQLPSDSKLYKNSLNALLFSLQTSPYAAIREKVASQLFEAFSLLIEEEEEKQINLALELLAQTDWSKWGDEKMNNSFEEIKRILIGI